LGRPEEIDDNSPPLKDDLARQVALHTKETIRALRHSGWSSRCDHRHIRNRKVDSNPGKSCAELCLTFNLRRSELCIAQADERRAQLRLSSLSGQREAALMTFAIASAAAIAAMFIPFIGSGISIAFATAAGVALTAAVGLAGAISTASEDLDKRAAKVLFFVAAIANARQDLLTQCPAEAPACLGTPAPC
jgi:hypothetical protein